MLLAEQHIINKNHKLYNYCNIICFQSKNLYNLANYYIRQEFIKNKKYLKYNQLDKLLQDTIDYKMLKAECSQQILRLLDKNWKSFFGKMKSYKKNKLDYKPKIPKYKHKTKGKNIVIISQNLTIKNNQIMLPMLLNENMINLSIKERNQYYKDNNLKRNYIKTKLNKINQIRITPQANCYIIELVYEKQEKEFIDNNRYMGIDIGLNNLATCTNNIGQTPFVINGKIIKSYNYYYNKKSAYYKSLLQKVNNKDYSLKLKRLTLKRNNKIKDYMHKASKYIINYCIEHDIRTIIIGKNDNWKNKIELGKKNNQNFVQIPFNMLIKQIEYKGKLNGIEVIVTEESYTSKASFIDNDIIPIYNRDSNKKYNFSGKRIYRGLYRSKDNVLINADVNGSYNIIRKVKPGFSYELEKGIKGVVLHPIVITL